MSAAGGKESGAGGPARTAAEERLTGYAPPYTPGPGSYPLAVRKEDRQVPAGFPCWVSCGGGMVLSGG